MATAKELLDRAQSAAEAGDNSLACELLRKVVLDEPATSEADRAHKTLRAQSDLRRASLVRIVDVDVPFGSMVLLFVKAALAAIPAAILLAVLAGIALVMLGGIGSVVTDLAG